MTTMPKSLSFAVIFVLVSAALHVIAPLLSGFSSEGLFLVPFGLLYGLIAMGLMRNMRWLAWVTFFILMFGGIFAMASAMSAITVPSWIYSFIAAADWAGAACLFGYLWNPKPAI